MPDPEPERVTMTLYEPTPRELISDHAVLRYLERAYHMDIEAIRREMMTGISAALDFGASTIIAHNVRLIIKDGIVVTVLPKRGKK